ncbi:DinB family protein [Flagellimonas nanhaiensis]|uniref:DinB family protein n=1 Tax=Flagellimonas nanhaiensis TaxID=2292706 RepID=A0A371JUH8_9FLAO|nr:DinB family protein [Allomuricauda nanhaiensis]RDY61464.1 DinB family protein [Allomuricauda nanhaiensis]
MSARTFYLEMEREFGSTKNLLDTVPESQLEYRPHEKAMSLGQLALHVASIPGRNLNFAKDGQVEASVIVQHPIPASKEEILAAFEQSVKTAKTLLENEDAPWLQSNWGLMSEGEPIAEMPAYAFVRTFVLNHWYHHRGQLSTYLRALDQELPSIYGPSADVNPFA